MIFVSEISFLGDLSRRRKVLRKAVLSVLMLMSIASNAWAAELPFARLNSSNRLTPLPTDSTTAMVFDQYGHLWLGIYSSGVGYYTGADLKVFNKEHGLDYLLVDALTIDDAGYLWVGTDHGLAISTAPVEAAYRGEAFAFQSKFPDTEIPVGTITAGPIAEPGSSAIWMLNDKAIYRIERGEDGTFKVRELPLGDVDAFKLTIENNRVTIFERGNVSFLDFNAMSLDERKLEELPCRGILGFVSHRGRDFLGCQLGGLYSRSHGSSAWEVIEKDVKIQGLSTFGESVTWFSSTEIHFGNENGRTYSIDQSSGFSVGEMYSVVESPTGTLWIGTLDGVLALPANFAELTTLNKRREGRGWLPLLSGWMSRASSVGGDWLWLGASELVIVDQSTLGLVGAYTLRDGEFARVACTDAQNEAVWMSTNERTLRFGKGPTNLQGFKSLNPVTWGGVTLEVQETAGEVDVTSCDVYRRPNGQHGVCLSSLGTIHCFDSELGRVSLDSGAGLPRGSMQGLAIGPEGHLWSGSYSNGLFRSTEPIEALLRGKSPRFENVWASEYSAPTTNAEAIVFIGRRFFVATEGGLLGYELGKKDPVLHVTTADGLINNYLYALAVESERFIWAGGNDGAYRIDLEMGKVVDRLGRSEGISSPELPWHHSMDVFGNGALVTTNIGGFYFYRPNGTGVGFGEPQQTVPALRKIDVADLGWRGNEVKATFSAGPQETLMPVYWRFRITGHQDTWTTPTTLPELSARNLDAWWDVARYTLEVQASTSLDDWEDETLEISFQVAAPFHRSWKGAIVGLLALILAGYLLVGYITQRERKRRQELERAVEEKTFALARSTEQSKALAKIGHTLVESLEFDAILQSFYENTAKLFPCDAFAIALYEHEIRSLNYALVVEQGERLPAARVSAVKPSTPGAWVVHHRKPLLMRDVAAEEEALGFRATDVVDGKAMASLIYYPLLQGESLLGVVTVQSLSKEAYSDGDLETMGRLASYAVSALVNQQAHQEAQSATLDALSAKEAAEEATHEALRQKSKAVSAQMESDTLRKEAEKHAEQLEELDKQKTAFFQNMSHELRTPLTLILGPLESASQVESANQDIQVATKNARRLLRLVNQLLDFQKMGAGKKELKLEPLNLVRFTHVVGDYFASASSSKDIEFLVTVDGAPLGLETVHTVSAEGDALEKVAFNFLSNALKYTPRGGTIEFGLRTLSEEVTLFVKDSGPGISEEGQTKLFQVFSQVEESTTREYEGTGLGLALVKSLVEEMGGRVGVESAPGEGSTFYATFPLIEAISVKPLRTCLLVEDDLPTLETYREILRKSSLFESIDGVATLKEARALLAESRYKLVVADGNLPDGDGATLLTEIRATEPDTKLILLTGEDNQARFEQALGAARIDQIILKPATRSEILKGLGALVEAYSGADEEGTSFQGRSWLLADGGETGIETDVETDDASFEEAGSGELILVVDDLEDMRNLIARSLSQKGYRVLKAANGEQGYQVICDRRPDLVISDWMMPKLSGPDMLKQVRANSDISTTPVILLTAKSDEESKLIGTEIGADVFLGKPFNEQELRSVVRNLLSLKSREKEVQQLNDYITESVLKRYLPPSLIGNILSGELSMDKPAELRDITVLFSDLKGFTATSEALGPEGISAFLNEYLTVMNEVIFEHGGTIDKFIGDAIMVLFGAPQDMLPAEQVRRATDCAKAMQRAMHQLTQAWKHDGAGDIKMRIGIHHGPAVVGNFGSAQRSDYTAIGPTVNLASRIESASTAGQVFVSEATAMLMGEGTSMKVGEFELKGIEGSTKLFQLV